MKKLTLLGIILIWLGNSIAFSQIVYVDNGTGSDGNAGTENAPFKTIEKALEIVRHTDNNIQTIKINPGIYVLDHHLSVETEKELDQKKRIVIEASILPDDPSWNPEKMPVIISEAMKGEFEQERWVVAFMINADHVTIRGLKFHGYAYPNTQYFPIARDGSKTDLLVQQSMFVADEQSSAMQVGVIGHGNEIKVDHCVFYKANNAVVYFQASGDTPKTGNRFTNNIVYGAAEAAIWTSWPDEDFVFENNIIANNNYFWKRYFVNYTNYTIRNSIIVNNDHYHIEVAQNGEETVPEYDFIEQDITKNGTVSLRLLDGVFHPIPKDHLHAVPGSPGSDLKAGLFMNRIQSEQN